MIFPLSFSLVFTQNFGFDQIANFFLLVYIYKIYIFKANKNKEDFGHNAIRLYKTLNI